MIMPVETLTSMKEFKGVDETTLCEKLDAVETLIRAYTHNNFQNRAVRFEGKSLNNRVFGGSPFLKVGDRVEITQSQVNDGLYTITEILDDAIRLDKALFSVDCNRVTKVEYPADIRQGIINLLIWEQKNRQKVGVKAETLSRHSVTYYDQDINNQVMGYPVSLLGFLSPYMKARF